MSDKKFDFECIYYTNELINKIGKDNFYLHKFILPEKLRYIVLQLVQNNFINTGKASISEEQLKKALEYAQEKTYDAVVDELVIEGKAEYVGIDDDGNYVTRLTHKGKEDMSELGNETE